MTESKIVTYVGLAVAALAAVGQVIMDSSAAHVPVLSLTTLGALLAALGKSLGAKA